MKLRRKKPVGRRQRVVTEEPVRPASNFSSRARRSASERDSGRKYGINSQSTKDFTQYWLKRFGMLALLVAIILSVINVLSLSSSPRIVTLASSGSKSFLRPQDDYQQAASSLFKASIWNHNKVTVNTEQIRIALLAKFPELTDVSVNVPLVAHRPVVYVEPAQPVLILVTGNGSFIIGSSGKALIRGDSPASLNRPELPVLNDQTGVRIELNHQALSADNVRFIQTIMGQLNAKKIAIASMTLPAATSELDVQITGQPYFAKFNLQSDNARGQAGTLLATMDTLKKQNITPTRYIDVRVDGRAYYQ